MRRQTANPPVSLKELAQHLRLSPTTVSRVVNQTPAAERIPEATQKRILAAAALMNYRPNAYARGLRHRRSFTVGVMVPEISEGYAAAVLSGIEDTLLQEEFFYFVVSHRHRAELLEGYPRLLLARAVEGIIAVDTPIRETLTVPVVAVSGHGKHKGMVTIELDHLSAARYALGHLAELGHRRIAFIKGQSFSSDTSARWGAIRKVCTETGLKQDPELVVQMQGAASGSEPGYLAARALLERKRPFTAIFAFNDMSALGAITALHEAGLHVPRDVSVVGFDDIPLAAAVHPGLTTVRQPLKEMGRIAAATLLSAIRGANGQTLPASIRVEPELVIRRSTSRLHTDRPGRQAR
ncbi:LacI family DNA-binding transcriptional regulator [Paracidobacterium acidisoli]|uniref:LacI family transcriptional regulator n=1 Tax=Paracidobacterium acidisoli TaxID=2303751 RepID=A0A372IL23_9BACT|nr:LacI family DNA-binding transcriptional regulator [Paracidobacterium acidisoli]MBT9332223.1 LacI family transcriptional regulator [Paracidobacterium acidisoli]